MSPNQQQCEAWNGGEALHWVDHTDRYDGQFAPYADALLAHAGLEAHHTVLDIGCGAGAMTLDAARSARHVVGIDISKPLTEIAIERAHAAGVDNVEFVVADAQTHAFDDGAFEVAVSKFGLMFFDDPEAAFANLRRAVVPGGLVAFVCWQELTANEWLSVVGNAVAQHGRLPELGGQAGGPGMFSLKHRDETAKLLDAAGYTDVEIEPIAPTILLGGGGSLDGAGDFFLGMGIARGLLGHVDDAVRDKAIASVRAALADRHQSGVGVCLGSAGWLVSAHA